MSNGGDAILAALPQAANILDACPAMLWSVDDNASCTYVNPAWLTFVGRKLEQELGGGWMEAIHPDDREHRIQLFRSRSAFTAEFRLRRADGEYRWVLDSAAPFFVADRFQGFTGCCVEIQHLKDIAAKSKADMETFVYSVSHDLRGPLRSIKSNVSFLVEDFGEKLDGEAKNYIDRAVNAVGRLDALIEGILQLSRIGRKELQVDQVDLSKLALAAGASDVEPNLTASCDADLALAVLQQLIGNSKKFGAAKVSVGREGDAFVVRDDGVGFDMAYSEKLFVPFERLHSPTDYPGAGIGLALVKLIVERHGGTVRAESEEGKGATFFFTLPEPA